MAFSAGELANIADSKLDHYIEKGTVQKQNVQNKPMLKAFEEAAGDFPGGKGNVSLGVKSGQGGGSMAGYTHDDQVSYYNPASNKRVNYAWKEHHIGIGLTHTELKIDGINVVEDGAKQSLNEVDGREAESLANLLDEKFDDMDEDRAKAWDLLLHGDGSGDAKAIAGIQSLILANPATGSTGGLSRSTYAWWRNRARTSASGGAIVSATTDGGALLQFLQEEGRQINRFASGGVKRRNFAGSDFIAALEKEVRANGNYSMTGFQGEQSGDMGGFKWMGQPITYDPTLDDLSFQKRMYSIDLRRVRLLYMKGERLKKSSPARPYDRYVMYRGLTSTAVMIAQQLNTSGVYDIA